MAVPEIVSVINMGYKYLYGVACLNNEEIWTHGDDKIMRLYNFNGELVKSIQTKSGNMPEDITVSKSRNLVFIDTTDKTLNIRKNKTTRHVIKQRD